MGTALPSAYARYRSGGISAIVVTVLLVAAMVVIRLNQPVGMPGVSCDGKAMGPGDRCFIMSRGSARTETYAEAVQGATLQRDTIVAATPVVLVALVMLLAYCIWVKMSAIRAPEPSAGDSTSWHGAPVRTHAWGMAIGVALICGAGMVIAAMLTGGEGISVMVLIPIGFALLGLLSFGYARPRPGQLLRLDEQGVKAASGRRLRSASWADVLGVARLGNDRWRVKLLDGARIDLGPGLSAGDVVANRLRVEMGKRRLEDLNSGGEAHFGSCVVSAEALSLRGQTIPWARVGGIHREQGTITVQGPSGPVKTAETSVDDVEVFLAMAASLIEHARAEDHRTAHEPPPEPHSH